MVTIGAPIREASAPTAAPAPDRAAPPPAQISGRSAAATNATPGARSGTDGARVGMRFHTPASAVRKSVGTPRYTGPCGAVVASSAALSA